MELFQGSFKLHPAYKWHFRGKVRYQEKCRKTVNFHCRDKTRPVLEISERLLCESVHIFPTPVVMSTICCAKTGKKKRC